ncbi:MAG: ATP-binding protein [Caulobacteraceae bacterium]
MPWKLADLAAVANWRSPRAGRRPPADLPDRPPGPDPRLARFEAMLGRLPDPILLVAGGDPADLATRRFLFANAAARDLLPIEREEGPLTTAIRAPEVLQAVEEALSTGRPSLATYRSGGAQDRVWRAQVLPLATVGEQLSLLILRDDTEAVRVERTRADFLANASHELRTPLASLAGFIETLRGRARDDPEAREKFLAIMQVQAERMRLLIEDLLKLSQIELDERIPATGRADLALAVQETLDALSPLAAERDIEFVTAFPDGGAVVTGDKHQVVRVIGNLLENAVRYSPQGGRVSVRIEAGVEAAAALRPVCPEGARHALLAPDYAPAVLYAALAVTDRGPGIAKIHLPRLTERFYRVEGQKPGKNAGTGLGLAIVKHIVRRHRGGLAVESREGAGATFTVYFPMAGPASG